jgi:FtsP/CotA-like multicopper oxidase with cupredoxin domain
MLPGPSSSLLLALFLALAPTVSLLGGCASSAAPAVPLLLQVPPGQTLVLAAQARGVQVYRCAAAADGTPAAWLLVGPDAILYDDDGQVIGKHFAGPTWEAKDGSRVVGTVAAKVDSPDAASVPWLLLDATSTGGPGVLARATHVQRLATAGGKPSAVDCNASTIGAQVRIPYQARYYFYAAGS